ncbi:hypothetical protein [Xanthomonas campestris]|uniref:hypothetical protein n=1 Tax=Xanthomonas campestris TaxID=339 RepID=UPI003CEC3684
MPLAPDNYENFFLGTAAEFRIASEVYFHGFEASKYTPDFGVDLAVTNAARVRFKGEEPSFNYLQVKATFVINNAATFYLSTQELEYLRSRSEITTVFCCVIPQIVAHPQSFDRGDFEPWRPALDAELDQQNYDSHFAELRKQHGCLSALDFKSFGFEYFWLNVTQLNRSIEEKCWEILSFPDSKVAKLGVRILDGAIELGSPEESLLLVNETRNLYYRLKPNASTARLDTGAFAHGH